MAIVSKAEVIRIRDFGFDIKEYILRLEKNSFFESGTYLQLTLDDKDDYTRWPECRNFSIASAYNDRGEIRLIIQRVGYYTSRIFEELTEGKQCTIKYSFGDFILPFYDSENPICCIAGGTGIAPMLSFIEELVLTDQINRLHIFYSFKKKIDAVGLEELINYVPEYQLYLFSTKDNIDGIYHRRIGGNDILTKNFDLLKTHFYICGNSGFTKYFKKILDVNGAINIYTDEW